MQFLSENPDIKTDVKFLDGSVF